MKVCPAVFHLHRMEHYLLIALLIVTLSTLSHPGSADIWTIDTVYTDRWLPDDISFVFDGSQLFLNNTYIYQPGGSSANSITLHLSGAWAVCGSILEGIFIPDPYATFIVDRTDVPPYEIRMDEYGVYQPYEDVWTVVGHVSWRPDTPPGYVTQVLLGKVFSGSGAETYFETIGGWPTTGTIVCEHWWHYTGYSNVSFYTAYNHAFSAKPPISVPIDIKPETLNLRSNGNFVTCLVKLPVDKVALQDINLDSLRLQGEIAPIPDGITIGNIDNNKAPDLLLKFSREDLRKFLQPGVNKIELTGSLTNGKQIAGEDNIKVTTDK